jgi:hypothetical protein
LVFTNLCNNKPLRDTITLPNATSFKDSNYIKISNAANPENNTSFFVDEVGSTNLLNVKKFVINELNKFNIGSKVIADDFIEMLEAKIKETLN